MPEGDTIHKLANYMRPRLVGQSLSRVVIGRQPVPELCGRTILAVEAVGKHMLMHLSPAESGWVLRSHLGLHGSWHRYALGERWKRPPWAASIILETAHDSFACFSAEDVECLRPQGLPRSVVSELGPDLLAAKCDMDEVVRRIAASAEDTLLVDLLLSQQIAAGIGNVYKCELLFMHRLPPLARRAAIPLDTWRTVYERARQLLLANLGPWRRTTTYDPRAESGVGKARLSVYGRVGQPCFDCDTTIRREDLGRTRRRTDWCPRCQGDVGL